MAIILKPENVAQLVFLIRGEKVMLDADLAMLYGLQRKRLIRRSDEIGIDSRAISFSSLREQNMTLCGHKL
jgi:hypothetical protein